MALRGRILAGLRQRALRLAEPHENRRVADRARRLHRRLGFNAHPARAPQGAKGERRQRRAARDGENDPPRRQQGPRRLQRGREQRRGEAGRVARVRDFAAQIEIERRDAVGRRRGEGAVARAEADVEAALRGAHAEAVLIGFEDALVAADAGGVGREAQKNERAADWTEAVSHEFGPRLGAQLPDGAAAEFARGDDLTGQGGAGAVALGHRRREPRDGAVLQRRGDQKQRDRERGGKRRRYQPGFVARQRFAQERAGPLGIGGRRAGPRIHVKPMHPSAPRQRPIMRRFYGFGVVNERALVVDKASSFRIVSLGARAHEGLRYGLSIFVDFCLRRIWETEWHRPPENSI